ncbi:MAG TPA: hypothetical protein VMN36_04765 [Verrucomicrobiales bacterium]|nr:hypothetical protein [Verrucomicrobiales bacterium]
MRGPGGEPDELSAALKADPRTAGDPNPRRAKFTVEESGGSEKVRGVSGVEKETRQPRASRKRKALIATALVGTVLGILQLGGAWKWGAFGAKANEKVFDLGNGVRMTFCWCPPGTFLMGSPVGGAGRRLNERQHEVTLTQGSWMAYGCDTPHPSEHRELHA